MLRLIASLAALAAIAQAAVPAAAYTPKPILSAKPGSQVTNPGAKRGIIIVGGKFNRVALNPQPLPPKFKQRYAR